MRADWIIDGMAAVKSVGPLAIWGEYVDAYPSFCTSPKTVNAAEVSVVMDTYGKNQTEEMIQRRRGDPGSYHKQGPRHADGQGMRYISG